MDSDAVPSSEFACPGSEIETGTKRTWPAAVRTSLKSVPEPPKDEDEEGIPPCLLVPSEWR